MESKETRGGQLRDALTSTEKKLVDLIGKASTKDIATVTAAHQSFVEAMRLDAEMAGELPTRGATVIVQSDETDESAGA